MQSHLASWLAVLLTLWAADFALANPSDKDPEAILAPWHELAQEKLLEAGPLYKQAAAELAQHEANMRDGKYAGGELRIMKSISETYLRIAQLQRIGDRVMQMGEPAGADIRLRAADLRLRVGKLIDQYRGLQGSLQLINQLATSLPRMSLAKQRSLAGIGTMFKQGKVDAAEKRLDEEINDEFEPILAWMGVLVVQETYKPFSTARQAVDDKMAATRKDEAAAALVQLRTDNDPQFNETLARIKTSLDGITAAGSADWNGMKLEGPELLLAWGDAWRDVLAKTLRCRAIDLARGIKGGVRPPSELDQIEAAYLQFDEQFVVYAGQLIAADAGRAIPEALPALYTHYVDAIASLTPQITSAKWMPTIEPALASLRDKSPVVAQQVKTYELATADVLRWRQRAALAAARGRIKAAKDIDQIWNAAAVREAMVDRIDRQAKPMLTFLSSGAPSLVRDVARVALTQPAWSANFAPAADGSTVSRYRNRVAVRLPQGRIPVPEIDKLRSDLLVSPTAPPLSLAAALAIKSAEQGYLQAAGGNVAGLELQSLLVHFMKLDKSAPHVALGPLPADTPAHEPGLPVEQMTYWFEIAPKWLQHEYIFVELP